MNTLPGYRTHCEPAVFCNIPLYSSYSSFLNDSAENSQATEVFIVHVSRYLYTFNLISNIFLPEKKNYIV